MARPLTLPALLAAALLVGCGGGGGEDEGQIPDSFRVTVDTSAWVDANGQPCGPPPPIEIVYTVTAARSSPAIAGHACDPASDDGDAWRIACEMTQFPALVTLHIFKDLSGGERDWDHLESDGCDGTQPLFPVELTD